MSKPGKSPRKVLFLCTGNYYRSRFAELLFNEYAKKLGLDWVAASSGLNTRQGNNPGPISQLTLAGLAARGITPPVEHRYPAQACDEDFAGCDLIIAVKEQEHRPMLEAAFPQWASRVKYWHVHDIGQGPTEEALARIEHEVRQLVEALRQSDKIS